MARPRNKPKKYLMYFDESGTANGASHGYFTLVACVIEKKDEKELANNLDDFKKECFNRDDIVLHLMDIITEENDFVLGKVTRAQIDYFKKNVSTFLKEQKFMLFSTTVDKKRLHEYYKSTKDEYSIAFTHIMKSIYHFLDDEMVEQVDIYLESRDETADFKVQKSFFESYHAGSIHLDVLQDHRDKIKRFVFKDKADNVAGLQLVDLVCSPVKTVRVYGSDTCKSADGINYDLEVSVFESIVDKFYNPLEYEDIKNWSFKKVPVIKKPGKWIDKVDK